jgi:hypothetical protein
MALFLILFFLIHLARDLLILLIFMNELASGIFNFYSSIFYFINFWSISFIIFLCYIDQVFKNIFIPYDILTFWEVFHTGERLPLQWLGNV